VTDARPEPLPSLPSGPGGVAPAVEPQFSEHLRVLWWFRWWSLGAAVLAALAVVALRSGGAPTYEAEARVRLVLRDDAGLVIDAEQADLAARTYAELAAGPAVLGAAVTTAGLPLTIGEAEDRVSASASTTPGFVDIVATGPNAGDASGLAAAVAAALVAVVVGDQAFDDGILGLDAVVEPSADPDGERLGTPVAAEAAVAFLVVLVVVAEGLALVRSARGGLRLGDPAGEAEELLGLPAIAVGADRRYAALVSLAPFVLRHLDGAPVLTAVQRGRPASSAGALLLAEAAGAVGRRSMLVDLDVSSPVLGARPGLAEVLAGAATPASVACRTAVGNVVVLNAGRDASVDEVVVPDLAARIAAIGADVAVVSTTSAVPRLESLLVVARVPSDIVVVLDPARSTRRQLLAAVEEARAVGHRIRAVLLVRTDRSGRLGRPAHRLVPLTDRPQDHDEAPRRRRAARRRQR